MTDSEYRWLNRILALALLLLLLAPVPLRVSADGDRILLPGGPVIPELCLYKRTTGLECGSCHLGRSFVLAVQGELEQSLGHHRGGIVLFGWIVVQAAARLLLSWVGLFWSRLWILDIGLSLAGLMAVAGVILVVGRS